MKDLKLKYRMLVMRIFPTKKNTERASRELMAALEREIHETENDQKFK